MPANTPVNDVVPSLIRTYVPLVVAAIVGWLGDAGLILGDDASTGLVAFLSALAGAAYYAAVRWAERRWPKVGVLLGSTRQPEYQD